MTLDPALPPDDPITLYLKKERRRFTGACWCFGVSLFCLAGFFGVRFWFQTSIAPKIISAADAEARHAIFQASLWKLQLFAVSFGFGMIISVLTGAGFFIPWMVAVNRRRRRMEALHPGR